MRKIAIYVATTGGPVQVERITPEYAPQSLVCLRRSSNVLPISGDYDDFVKRGSGVIEREFGPFDYQSFRLDVSDNVGARLSWQLAFFAAHAVSVSGSLELAEAEDNPDQIFWLTGRVDYDLSVGEVDHLAEKLAASADRFSAWMTEGIPVAVVCAPGNNHEDVKNQPELENCRILALNSAEELRREFEVTGEGEFQRGGTVNDPGGRATAVAAFDGKKVVALIILFLAIASALVVAAADTGAVGAWKRNLLAKVGLSDAPDKSAALSIKTNKAVSGTDIGFDIFERLPPEGKNCAQVHFSGIAAATKKITKNDQGKIQPSSLIGLCGLLFAFDLGITSKYLAAYIEVESGRFISAGSKPRILSGRKLINGRHSWPIDVPRRLEEPFVYKIVSIAGNKPVADKISWLKNHQDWSTAVKELSANGMVVTVNEHRVEP